MLVTSEYDEDSRVTSFEAEAFVGEMGSAYWAVPDVEESTIDDIACLVRGLLDDETADVANLTVKRYEQNRGQPTYRMSFDVPDRIPRIVLQSSDWDMWDVVNNGESTHILLTYTGELF